MGTKVHSKSYLPGYYSMRDLNEDCSSSSWPLCYGDKAMTNGQYYNGFTQRVMMDGYPGYGKDALKQKMLEHESVFRNQVYELHRLYRIQRELMEEVKRKELNRIRASVEQSSSSSLRGSQVPSEDARKWHVAGLPLFNSGYERTSISRVEIVNSPMSCTKGNNTQTGQFPFQNGSSLKDSELLDTRPLKVRKKLFDLELPADEYIDTEEDKKSPDCKVSDVSSCAPNGLPKSGPASRVRNPIGLADLNEPIEIEEAMPPSSTDFLGHSSINGEIKGIKSNAGYISVIEEKKHHRDGFLINSSNESKVDDRGRLSHMYGAGSSKINLNSVSQGIQKDKLPIPCHHPSDYSPGIYPTGRSKEDLWRDRCHHGLEASDRTHNQSNNKHLEPHLASEAHPSDPSSHFASSWAHSVSSWAKPISAFTQKMTTLESSSNSAAECREIFGGKWRVSDSSRLNPGIGVEIVTRNGFYHGSASGPKELKVHLPSSCVDYLSRCRGDNDASGPKELKVHLPSSCVDYLSHCRGDNVASDHTTNHGYGHFPKGSCLVDSKPAIDINLNEVVPKSSSNEAMILQDVSTINGKGKPQGHVSSLPWLNNKPAHALSCKAETVVDLNQPFTPPKVMLATSERNTEISKNQNVEKILGFPIFETGDLKNELSSHGSTSASLGCPPHGNIVNKERRNIVIDINLECEPEEQIAAEEQTVEKDKLTKGASVRECIDLNSCVTECEDFIAPSYESKATNVKVIMDIDLESPLPMEEEDANTPEETKIESPQDEVLRNAADTIVAISSSYPEIRMDETASNSLQTSLTESLLWFVDTVSSCANELKSTSGKDSSPMEVCEEMDDFEAMTLQIPETKEEDYMPTPFVPEVQNVEDTGASSLPTRPRRGQSRRGRQRRDFQRDILPGLTSLSRHEVTEDLQTFGGLMRATGHHWISGLTRRNGTRNGGGRGRRRAVVETVSTATPSPVCTPLIQQLNSIEAGLEDRSLTGWGKTTRRPRRQRCPAGNPPAVVST